MANKYQNEYGKTVDLFSDDPKEIHPFIANT